MSGLGLGKMFGFERPHPGATRALALANYFTSFCGVIKHVYHGRGQRESKTKVLLLLQHYTNESTGEVEN